TEEVGILELLTKVALEVDAPLGHLHFWLEASPLPLPAEGFGDLLVALIPPGGRVEDDLQTVRVAGFREKLSGSGRVWHVALDGGVIAEHLGREWSGETQDISLET